MDPDDDRDGWEPAPWWLAAAAVGLGVAECLAGVFLAWRLTR